MGNEKGTEWLSSLRAALDYIEAHLEDDVDVASVAAHVYLSPMYLGRGFQIVTGCTIGEYIRSRRLYEAALVLAAGEASVLDTALRFGYETPEAFTKAFTRFHGASPSVIRREPARIRHFLPFRINLSITGGDMMEQKFVVSPMWGMKLIGFEREFSYEEGQREIPKFWDEICEKYCNHTIYAGLAPSCPEERAIIDNCIGEYGVCVDDIGGGKFRYLIAGRYTGGEVPATMKIVELPGGEWAKFTAVGPMPEALQRVNNYVFREWLPGNPDYELAGLYNLEWYSCDGNKDDADYQSGVWVPVRKRAGK